MTRAAGQSRKSSRTTAIVYGNCQAEPLRKILLRSEAFNERYDVIRVPPVHSISVRELAGLKKLLPEAGLILAQPIKNGLRGMELGLEEIVSHAAPDTGVVTWPSIYWEPPFPFSVYVHPQPRVSELAPVITYHDLRFLACASQGLSKDQSMAFLEQYEPPTSAYERLRMRARSLTEEKELRCDVKILEWMTTKGVEGRAMWTVNHPASFVLQEVARQVHSILDLEYVETGGPDLLAELSAPIEVPGLIHGPTRDQWVLNNKVIPRDELLAVHLNWYRERPNLVKAGLAEHRERLDWLDLAK